MTFKSILTLTLLLSTATLFAQTDEELRLQEEATGRSINTVEEKSNTESTLATSEEAAKVNKKMILDGINWYSCRDQSADAYFNKKEDFKRVMKSGALPDSFPENEGTAEVIYRKQVLNWMYRHPEFLRKEFLNHI